MDTQLNMTLSKRKSSFDLTTVVLRCFTWLMAGMTGAILIGLLGYIFISGIPYLKPDLFSWKYTTDNVSMLPALINTFLMVGLSLLISVPIGVGSAVYLNEYAKPGSRVVKVIMVAAQTLAGVPSIVFGLFGMLMFVKFFHLGLSLLSGALTLSLMVLPSILQTSLEALKAQPMSLREGSYGLGAGKLRTVFVILLPAASTGILSGIILAMGRMMGETAALIYTSGTLGSIAWNLTTPGSTLAVHMYKLMNEGLFMNQAAAVSVVLTILVLTMNLLSGMLQQKILKGRV